MTQRYLVQLLISRLCHCSLHSLYMTWPFHWPHITWLHMNTLGRLAVLLITHRFLFHLILFLVTRLLYCWFGWPHMTWLCGCWLHWLHIHTLGILIVLVFIHRNNIAWDSCLLVSSLSSEIVNWLTWYSSEFKTDWDYSLLEHMFWLGFDTNIFFEDLFLLGWSALLDIKLALEAIKSELLWGCIKLNSRVVAQGNTTLPSWLVTWNVTSFKHWVCGCTASNLQEPITLILSVVYVPISNLMPEPSFLQPVSLKINL